MAESILFSIAESLIEKLGSHAYEEAFLAVGVYDDLRDIRKTLSFVKAVLLDAEQEQQQNNELREWVRQLKQVFYDADDVLGEFECEALRKQVVKTYGSTMRKVRHYFSSSNPLVFRFRMAHQIKNVKERLDKVAANKDKFGLKMNGVDRRVVHRREETYSHVIPSNVIGRDEDKEKIIELLLQPHPNGDDSRSPSVIPIVGLGGMGKTTLAKLVFNDKRINDESFPLKMWVCVSDDFEIKQLIIKIINSCAALAHQGNIRKLNIEPLQIHLRNKLAGQKFLLVLDDVWNNDRDKWEELRDLLQVGAKGSKILVTTRSNSIAKMMGGANSSYILEGLSPEDSLSLFVKRAFIDGQEGKYPDLVEIGKEIVSKCGGVPLAVRTLGSSLYSKIDKNEWESIRDNEIWRLEQSEQDILPALKLSYDQMSSYLRRCFACFSLFPKDYRFVDREAARLWEALGLLPSTNKDKTLDVAREYLYDLLSISFLQEFEVYETLFTFKIHDLVHDLALYIAKDEFQLVDFRTEIISESVRHLSFVENDLLGKASIPKSKDVRLRAIMFPMSGLGVNNQGLLNTWVTRYEYLRYLDLRDSSFETLPGSIGKLKHLRYLSLSRNTRIKRLPTSVCNLQNLQFFYLLGCTELETLPKGFRNLISLRYLGITTKQSILLENDIANLHSLQVLNLDCCNNLESLLEGISLPTLQILSIERCRKLKSLPLHLSGLQTLWVDDCDKLELLEGHDHQIPNLKLRSLWFNALPQLVAFPQWLQGAAATTLHVLSIVNCDNLEELPEWLPTLAHLNKLMIENCPKLLSLPNDMHQLTALKFLSIKGCPELCKKCQPQVGEYWSKISHINRLFIEEPEDLQE